MKKTLLFTLIALLSLQVAHSQKLEKIKGNKQVVLSERVFDSLSTVVLHKNIVLMIVPAKENKLIINADENLHDIVITTSTDGVLDIDLSQKIVNKKRFELTLFLATVTHFTLYENTQVKNLKTYTVEDFSIILRDRSKADLQIEAGSTTIDATNNARGNFVISSENALISALDFAKINLSLETINASFKAEQKALITSEGTITQANFELKNNATVKAENLEINQAEISVTEDVVLSIKATETLTVSASGKSKTHIYGNPKINLTMFNDKAILFKE